MEQVEARGRSFVWLRVGKLAVFVEGRSLDELYAFLDELDLAAIKAVE
jgi:hypothetical protein